MQAATSPYHPKPILKRSPASAEKTTVSGLTAAGLKPSVGEETE